MIKYIVEGGQTLEGKVTLSGNKNSTFPCLAASLLTEDRVTLHNMPNIADVGVFCQILEALGVTVERTEHTISLQANKLNSGNLPEELTSKLRGSILLAGALVARLGKVKFSHPGGDIIGQRAINLHLEGFAKLGCKIKTSDRSYQVLKTRDYSNQDAQIFLELPTVTGTENLVLASVLKPGTTVIRNAASEPHIVDLCQMLNRMGGQIGGVGTTTLTIVGVEKLSGVEFTLSPDMIEFGTFAVAAAITQGSVEIEGIENLDYEPIIWPLRKMGVSIEKKENSIKVSAKRLKAIPTLVTNVWPGFPTDLMSVMIVLATQANGISLMHDWVYESRMFFVDRLIGMGAKIIIADPHRVFIYGPVRLRARNQDSPDIRAGIALVLAALVAKGTSTINRAELIERGYESVVDKLSNLGAKIERTENRDREIDHS